MKQILRDYFTFNKRERNGIFILLAIIAVELIYLNTSSYFYSVEPVDLSSFEKEIKEFEASIVFDSVPVEKPFYNKPVFSERSAERFNFDPNNLSEKDWKRLGLSDKQIKTIKNYESKGGKFKRKEDLKKMYCIKQELYQSLEPYIRIRYQVSDIRYEVLDNKQPISNIQNPTSVIELNTCDSATLTTIKGIGPFFAKSIIKYRDQLGGFRSKEQLLEIWKFDKEKYEVFAPRITIDASLVKQININMAGAEQLIHPYINRNIANAIVNYRKNHGRFKTIEEIRKTDLVDEETLRKIADYLTVD